MATATYDLISEQVLGSSSATVTFNSIAGTYKDLCLEFIGNATVNDTGVYFRLNNDSATNYSWTELWGANGTSTGISGRGTTVAQGHLGGQSRGLNADTNYPSAITASFQSYANTSVYKTVLSRSNMVASNYFEVGTTVSLWRSTSAVTRIDVIALANAFATGTTCRLWGIA